MSTCVDMYNINTFSQVSALPHYYLTYTSSGTHTYKHTYISFSPLMYIHTQALICIHAYILTELFTYGSKVWASLMSTHSVSHQWYSLLLWLYFNMWLPWCLPLWYRSRRKGKYIPWMKATQRIGIKQQQSKEPLSTIFPVFLTQVIILTSVLRVLFW